MKSQKNTRVGKLSLITKAILIFFYFTSSSLVSEKEKIIMNYTKIKILDKISSKNVSLELINGENFKTMKQVIYKWDEQESNESIHLGGNCPWFRNVW